MFQSVSRDWEFLHSKDLYILVDGQPSGPIKGQWKGDVNRVRYLNLLLIEYLMKY